RLSFSSASLEDAVHHRRDRPDQVGDRSGALECADSGSLSRSDPDLYPGDWIHHPGQGAGRLRPPPPSFRATYHAASFLAPLGRRARKTSRRDSQPLRRVTPRKRRSLRTSSRQSWIFGNPIKLRVVFAKVAAFHDSTGTKAKPPQA